MRMIGFDVWTGAAISACLAAAPAEAAGKYELCNDFRQFGAEQAASSAAVASRLRDFHREHSSAELGSGYADLLSAMRAHNEALVERVRHVLASCEIFSGAGGPDICAAVSEFFTMQSDANAAYLAAFDVYRASRKGTGVGYDFGPVHAQAKFGVDLFGDWAFTFLTKCFEVK